jgi:hypothetical protein
MVIGGIPSNGSYKSKEVDPDQDDEQESFFIHPKNQQEFNEHPNSQHMIGSKLFNRERDDEKEGDQSRYGVNQSQIQNKSKNDLMKMLFQTAPKAPPKNNIKDALLKKI